MILQQEHFFYAIHSILVCRILSMSTMLISHIENILVNTKTQKLRLIDLSLVHFLKQLYNSASDYSGDIAYASPGMNNSN